MNETRSCLVVLVALVGCERSARSVAPGRDAAPISADASSTDATEPIVVPAPPGPYAGPACDARFAPLPQRDPSPMCFQPGGTFLMGSPEGEGEPDERPQRKVTLSPFFIDQFEVTRAQFARFLNEASHGLACDEIGRPMCPGVTTSAGLPWPLDLYQDGVLLDWRRQRYPEGAAWRFAARPGEEQLPMDEITIFAARAYCRWAGKSLPTEAQWEYAARVEPLTGRARRYVWGDRFERGRANCSKEECRDPHRFHAPVDSMPGDVSATGVRGMAGNVSEWVDGCHTAVLEDCGECTDPVRMRECQPRREIVAYDGQRVSELFDGWSVRGGNYRADAVYTRAASRGGNAMEGQGVRCAVSALPGGD